MVKGGWGGGGCNTKGRFQNEGIPGFTVTVRHDGRTATNTNTMPFTTNNMPFTLLVLTLCRLRYQY